MGQSPGLLRCCQQPPLKSQSSSVALGKGPLALGQTRSAGHEAWHPWLSLRRTGMHLLASSINKFGSAGVCCAVLCCGGVCEGEGVVQRQARQFPVHCPELSMCCHQVAALSTVPGCLSSSQPPWGWTSQCKHDDHVINWGREGGTETG